VFLKGDGSKRGTRYLTEFNNLLPVFTYRTDIYDSLKPNAALAFYAINACRIYRECLSCLEGSNFLIFIKNLNVCCRRMKLHLLLAVELLKILFQEGSGSGYYEVSPVSTYM